MNMRKCTLLLGMLLFLISSSYAAFAGFSIGEVFLSTKDCLSPSDETILSEVLDSYVHGTATSFKVGQKVYHCIKALTSGTGGPVKFNYYIDGYSKIGDGSNGISAQPAGVIRCYSHTYSDSEIGPHTFKGSISSDSDSIDFEIIPNCQEKTWYRDSDGDGYGSSSQTSSCTQPSGYVSNKNDCDDNNAAVYEKISCDYNGKKCGSAMVCAASCPKPPKEKCDDGIDNDCDGDVDEGSCATICLDADKKTWYKDKDSDGYGNSSSILLSCDQPSGYVSNSNDCNDNNAALHSTIYCANSYLCAAACPSQNEDEFAAYEKCMLDEAGLSISLTALDEAIAKLCEKQHINIALIPISSSAALSTLKRINEQDRAPYFTLYYVESDLRYYLSAYISHDLSHIIFVVPIVGTVSSIVNDLNTAHQKCKVFGENSKNDSVKQNVNAVGAAISFLNLPLVITDLASAQIQETMDKNSVDASECRYSTVYMNQEVCFSTESEKPVEITNFTAKQITLGSNRFSFDINIKNNAVWSIKGYTNSLGGGKAKISVVVRYPSCTSMTSSISLDNPCIIYTKEIEVTSGTTTINVDFDIDFGDNINKDKFKVEAVLLWAHILPENLQNDDLRKPLMLDFKETDVIINPKPAAEAPSAQKSTQTVPSVQDERSDLTVTKFRLEKKAQNGSICTAKFELVLANNGEKKAKNVGLAIMDSGDDLKYTKISQIAAGRTKTVHLTVRFDDDIRPVASIDPSNKIKESDESNNELELGKKIRCD